MPKRTKNPNERTLGKYGRHGARQPAGSKLRKLIKKGKLTMSNPGSLVSETFREASKARNKAA